MRPALWILLAAVLTFVAAPFLEPLERRAFDERLRLRQDRGWPDDLVGVVIDDAAQRMHGRWPWPRDVLRDLIVSVDRLGARTIILDGLLAAPTEPDPDLALEAVIHRVFLPLSFTPRGGEETTPADVEPHLLETHADPGAALPADRIVMPLERYASRARGVGHSLFYPQADGRVRGFVPMIRIGDDPRALPSLAIQALMAHRGHDWRRTRWEEDRLLLPDGGVHRVYRGEMYLDMVPGGARIAEVMAKDLLTHRDDATAGRALDGKLALIYVDSEANPDTLPSPLGNRSAGGLLIAYGIRTLDGGHVPVPVSRTLALFTVLAVALAASPWAARWTPGRVLMVFGAAALLFGLVAIALVRLADLFAPVVVPMTFLVAAGSALSVYVGREADRDRRRLRTLLDASVAAERAALGGGERVFASALAPAEEDRTRASERDSMSELLTAGHALATPVQLGRYRVMRTLGRGGMGAIFLAVDEDLQRPVAIKILEAAQPDAYARFKREALAVARISHPNVVQIHEIGINAGVPFIVMEFVPGGTVLDLLRQPDVLDGIPWVRATRIIAGVAAGLGAAHEKGIVHRDVKPSNLLLMRRDGDIAKVADFGIAKLGEGEALTREGSFLGTVGYLAPEQARGLAVDARTDVYSLGVTCYRMLTGRNPFEGSTAQVLRATVEQRVPDPRRFRPEIPPEVADLVVKMTASEPSQRFADGNAASAALRQLLDGIPMPLAR